MTLLLIVSSPVSAQDTRLIQVKEGASFGHINDPVEFSGVRGLALWDDEVLVLEPNRVVRLTREGELIGFIGRQGAGPGEFLNAARFGVWRDTLWVSDLSQRRITYFATMDSVARTLPLNTSYAGPEGYRLAVAAPLTDSSYAVSISMNSAMVASGHAATRYHFIIDNYGTVFDTLFSVPLVPHDVGVLDSGGRFGQPIREAPLTTFSIVTGRRYQIDRRLPEGANGYTIRSRDLVTGAELGSFRHYVEPARVPDLFFGEWLDMFDRETNSLLSKSEVSDALFRPEFFPSVDQVSATSDGVIWVAHRSSGNERKWDALGADGRRLFQIALPSNHSIRESDVGGVWSVGLGEFGEQYVSYWEYVR